MKLTYMLLVSSYTTSSKRTGHRIAYSFLYWSERFVRCIWPSKGVPAVTCYGVLNLLQIVRRYKYIGIKDNEEVALGTFKTIVAGLALPLIFFEKVFDIQSVGIAFYDMLGRSCRTILHDNDLKILVRLTQQRVQQLLDFVRSII